MPTQTEFITDGGAFELPGAPGSQAHRCAFAPSLFQDGLFQRYGIPFPASLGAAVPKRRAEFLAGRYAARQAMESLGVEAVAIGIGSHREPLWPESLVGSISHCGTRAYAVVAHRARYQGLGIDCEAFIPSAIAHSIKKSIIQEEEGRLLAECPLPFEQALTLVFSAKEALFKALYPLVQTFFDFHAATVSRVDLQGGVIHFHIEDALSTSVRAGSEHAVKLTLLPEGVFSSMAIFRDQRVCSGGRQIIPR